MEHQRIVAAAAAAEHYVAATRGQMSPWVAFFAALARSPKDLGLIVFSLLFTKKRF